MRDNKIATSTAVQVVMLLYKKHIGLINYIDYDILHKGLNRSIFHRTMTYCRWCVSACVRVLRSWTFLAL